MSYCSVRHFQNGIVTDSAEWCASASRWNDSAYLEESHLVTALECTCSNFSHLIAVGHIHCMEHRTIIEAVIPNCSKSSVFAEFDGLQCCAAAMVGRRDTATAAEGGGVVWRIISTGYCIFESCIGKMSLFFYYFCTIQVMR